MKCKCIISLSQVWLLCIHISSETYWSILKYWVINAWAQKFDYQNSKAFHLFYFSSSSYSTFIRITGHGLKALSMLYVFLSLFNSNNEYADVWNLFEMQSMHICGMCSKAIKIFSWTYHRAQISKICDNKVFCSTRKKKIRKIFKLSHHLQSHPHSEIVVKSLPLNDFISSKLMAKLLICFNGLSSSHTLLFLRQLLL